VEELRSWRRRNNFHKNSAILLYLEGKLDNISQKQWSFWVYITFVFEERRWVVTNGVADFTGTSYWAYRFMTRHRL